MAVFLLGYREDEERQADFVEKRPACSPLLAMTASFTSVTILTEI